MYRSLPLPVPGTVPAQVPGTVPGHADRAPAHASSKGPGPKPGPDPGPSFPRSPGTGCALDGHQRHVDGAAADGCPRRGTPALTGPTTTRSDPGLSASPIAARRSPSVRRPRQRKHWPPARPGDPRGDARVAYTGPGDTRTGQAPPGDRSFPGQFPHTPVQVCELEVVGAGGWAGHGCRGLRLAVRCIAER